MTSSREVFKRENRDSRLLGRSCSPIATSIEGTRATHYSGEERRKCYRNYFYLEMDKLYQSRCGMPQARSRPSAHDPGVCHQNETGPE